MKKDYFISVLFVVALCFGQLASNVHLVGHLSVPSEQHDHAHAHAHHAQPAPLNFQTGTAEASGPDNELLDCAIYHTFAGTNGLATIDNIDIALHFACVGTATLSSTAIIAGPSSSLHIRGPPPKA